MSGGLLRSGTFTVHFCYLASRGRRRLTSFLCSPEIS